MHEANQSHSARTGTSLAARHDAVRMMPHRALHAECDMTYLSSRRLCGSMTHAVENGF